MSVRSDSPEMLTALVQLREALDAAALPLDQVGVAQLRGERQRLIDQLEDYVLPRLLQIDAPLLTVVGGSTGAGKSTLVNSLVGSRVSEPGVLRPTTRSPVLVHHPDDAAWFQKDRILPNLTRTTGAADDTGSLHLVPDAALPAGLAVLDAPDIDSVVQQNRHLAAELLGAADLWLFVTSAARYADQVPWEFLRQAAERATAVAIVLDRTAPSAVTEVSSHLARMLTTRGLRDSPLFVVEETAPDDDGLLPPVAVAEIRGWLTELAADAEARAGVVAQTLDGAIRNLARKSHDVADACDQQVAAGERLRADARATYAEAVRRIDEASADGTLLRGEVLARWQEFVGTGELLRNLEGRVGRARDRLVGMVRGRPQQVERVTVAVESGLETLVVEEAEAAAERTAASWRSGEAGRGLMEAGAADLDRASRGLRQATERAVRDWQAAVMELVREQGADRRATARFLAFGVNGLSVALMIVVFVHTAGLSGAEAGIAGGGAVVGQKLLEAVFGDQAVRRLVTEARRDLDRRVAALLDDERARYDRLLDSRGLDLGAGERLRDATRTVDDVRFAATIDEEGKAE